MLHPKGIAIAHVVALASAFPAAAAQLDWEVVNRFPLFSEASDFEAVKAKWATSGLASETVDSPEFTGRLRTTLPIRRTAWDARTGTYNASVLFRSRHEIRVWVSGVGPGIQCTFVLSGEVTMRSLCAEGVKASVGARKPFSVVATPEGIEALQLNVPAIRERLIVAVGDSFASGEGNPDYPTIFHSRRASLHWYIEKNPSRLIKAGAQWWDEACHRSLLSWPALTALSQAIANPREVVQFASLACSGAEAYDGFLRAQVDPPGTGLAHLRSGSIFKRDGGAGYGIPSSSEFGENTVQGQRHKAGWLPLSQQHALAHLLCVDAPPKRVKVLSEPAVQPGVTGQQTYFGNVDLFGCSGKRREVDQLLLSIGGNDVGFSGIVKWMITPPTARNAFNEFFLRLARNHMQVLEPAQVSAGLRLLPDIYGVVGAVLKEHGIDPSRITLLQYPDPTEGAVNLKQCNSRTREGNAPMQGLVKEKIYRSTFLFGINETEFNELKASFLEPLRKIQFDAAKRLGWRIVDSQKALTLAGGHTRGYCGVSEACKDGQCPSGDRVRWWIRPAYSDTPRLEYLTEFDTYDPTRVRGFRYGVDALLASAAPAGKGRIRSDWLSGSAHPTANIHARIADVVNGH